MKKFGIDRKGKERSPEVIRKVKFMAAITICSDFAAQKNKV